MSNITYDVSRTISVSPLENGLYPARWIRRHGLAWMRLVLVGSDGLSLFLAVLVGLLLGGQLTPDFYIRFSPFGLVFIAIAAVRGLYPSVGLAAEKELRSLTVATCIAFITMAAVTFLLREPRGYSRVTYMSAWALALVLVPLNRHLARWLLARLDLWGEAVAVIGPLADCLQIVGDLRKRRRIGRRPVVIFTGDDFNRRTIYPVPIFPLENVDGYSIRYPVSTALVIQDDLSGIETVRERYREHFERVLLVNLADQGLRLSGVSVREFGGVLSLEIHHTLMDRWEQREKRIVDILGSFIGLLFLVPLFTVVGVLIKLDSPGPIFYYQPRLGKGGRKFRMVKFRTMHTNADVVLKKYLLEDPAKKAEWDQYQKLTNDPRITRVGAVLRRFSIDELPQFWNVLVGDMSLVGPRPIMLDQADTYGSKLDHYQRVRPGISGMWQINGRNQTTFARRAELDYQYVLTWSFWLDIYILARTVWVVLRREGAS